jgi:hypothetical protein
MQWPGGNGPSPRDQTNASARFRFALHAAAERTAAAIQYKTNEGQVSAALRLFLAREHSRLRSNLGPFEKQ